MSKYSVSVKEMKTASSDFAANAKVIETLAERIVNCKKQMEANLSDLSGHAFSIQLGALNKQILEKAAQLNSFHQALNTIVDMYTKCELVVLDGNGEVVMESAEKSGTDKRGWFRKLWDRIFHVKIDTDYVATTAEQESAIDRKMKDQIQNLLQADRYSEERWENASFEERKQILTEYMQEVAGIMGVTVKQEIEFTNTPPSDGVINLGQYSHSNRRVYINAYVIENRDPDDSYALLTTVTHELRHAYQHAAVDDPTKFQVSRETIESWKESFRTYAREQAKGYEAYRNIVVERDARAFAGQG